MGTPVQLVPTVDLRAADAPARIDDALREVGFMAVTGHGVPASRTAAMLDAIDELFSLPDEVKRRLPAPGLEVNRGYTARGTEAHRYTLGARQSPPDLFEAFNLGPEHWPAGDPAREQERHRYFAPNVWPDHPSTARVRPGLVDWFDAMASLAHRLTGLFATALGLDGGWFEGFTDHSTDTLRVINYERLPGEPEPVDGQQRLGAHTDYGICTVLYADPVPGLQIVAPDGGWHDVVCEPGTLLVNIGDLLAIWTNDRWRSTLHRVVTPPSGDTPARRRSAAFFHDGNYDARVECLPTCASATDPARYAPVIAGEHLLAKIRGQRTLEASTAVSTAAGRGDS